MNSTLPRRALAAHRQLASRHARTALDIEAQQAFRPVARVVHADARPPDDRYRGLAAARGDVEVVAQEVVGVQPSVNFHRPAQQAWSRGASLDILRSR